MKYNPKSRRLFLCGAGAALVLPALRSLMPREAYAGPETTPPRYIQVLNPYGPSASLYYGALKANQNIEPYVNVKALSELEGAMSPILGDAFTPFTNKLSVLRGIDVLAENWNHQYCFPTCASSYAAGLDNDEAPPTSGQESIDVLLSNSAKMYGPEVPAVRRSVVLNPVITDDYSKNRSFSWRSTNAKLEMVRPVKQTQAFFDAFASGFGAVGDGDPRETALLQAVHADYKKVRDSSRISAADKQKLESYMSLVADIQKGAGTCSPAMQEDEVDIEAVIANQFRILAAAMVCDLTRVASITLGMSMGTYPRHEQHHKIYGKTLSGATASELAVDLKLTGARVAKLLGILDAVVEPSGTLLDNSLVYWSMQYGCVVIGGEHSANGMPVMVAGGAGGKLKQGHYIDFREPASETLHDDSRRGIPMNNLLVTFMNCMGLSSSDYEATPGKGYGSYPPNALAKKPNGAFWDTTAGRRSPVPFLYTGEAMG
ncbi:DUF1552 domain-containing protein [Polyangium jinanense]|uniref:DUF1552 domain-containing protein n=1 Tax=Polyangium jinanense TaxID=2829994 RepID=A0A9X3X132_9BACT|nr:DUF1552 domain-containing protein [Polyangium jinanense]MDC3953369.1 DUF1552 domain-containing protein [Polyangium jinanense]MDC3979511.1 DUF1552 domain-containing protein [Polyangium jinanense]